MEWNKETKTLTISWMDLEHISGVELVENIEWEMEVHGIIGVPVSEIQHIVVNTADKVVIGCSLCPEKAEIFVKSHKKIIKSLCQPCWYKINKEVKP